jgi:hypothetical protein
MLPHRAADFAANVLDNGESGPVLPQLFQPPPRSFDSARPAPLNSSLYGKFLTLPCHFLQASGLRSGAVYAAPGDCKGPVPLGHKPATVFLRKVSLKALPAFSSNWKYHKQTARTPMGHQPTSVSLLKLSDWALNAMPCLAGDNQHPVGMAGKPARFEPATTLKLKLFKRCFKALQRVRVHAPFASPWKGHCRQPGRVSGLSPRRAKRLNAF